MKKIFLLIASAVMIIFLSSTVFSADISKNTVELKINSSDIITGGETQKISSNQKVTPVIDSETGKVYVPLRCVLESMGYNISWDAEENTVHIDQMVNIALKIGQKDVVLRIPNYEYNERWDGYGNILNPVIDDSIYTEPAITNNSDGSLSIEELKERYKYLHSKTYTLTDEPKIIYDHTYVPLEFFTKVMGFNVHGNKTSGDIVISLKTIDEIISYTGRVDIIEETTNYDGEETTYYVFDATVKMTNISDTPLYYIYDTGSLHYGLRNYDATFTLNMTDVILPMVSMHSRRIEIDDVINSGTLCAYEHSEVNDIVKELTTSNEKYYFRMRGQVIIYHGSSIRFDNYFFEVKVNQVKE